MCNKVGYDTKADANADIKQLSFDQKKYSRTGGGSHAKAGRKASVYACRHCDKFHVTTQKKHKGKPSGSSGR